MVIAAATTFALNGTVSKLLIQGGFDPPQLTTFRAAGAFLGLLAFILATRGPRPLKASRREIPRLIIFGLVGFFLVPMLYFVAISRLPVGIGLLFEFTAPPSSPSGCALASISRSVADSGSGLACAWLAWPA